MSRGGVTEGGPVGEVDPEVFMDLVRSHDRGLRMLAYRLLQDRTAMDDAMQDAYLKAFRAFSGFRGEAEARTWLYRIVYNVCLDQLRRGRRRRDVPLDQAVVPGGDPELCTGGCAVAYRGLRPRDLAARDQTAAVVQRADLATALASLPDDRRAAVLLVDAAGFSYEEAAEVLGVRSGTIGSRLHHARSVLRATLAEGRDDATF